MTGRNKERIVQSKRARAGSFIIVDQPLVARTCTLRVFLFTDAILPSSAVRSVSSIFYLNPRPLVQSV